MLAMDLNFTPFFCLTFFFVVICRWLVICWRRRLIPRNRTVTWMICFLFEWMGKTQQEKPKSSMFLLLVVCPIYLQRIPEKVECWIFFWRGWWWVGLWSSIGEGLWMEWWKGEVACWLKSYGVYFMGVDCHLLTVVVFFGWNELFKLRLGASTIVV